MTEANDRGLGAWRGGLSSADVEHIHEQSLHLLSTVGFRLTDPEAQALTRKAGASVDEVEGRVRLPPELVAWALDQSPHKITRYALDGKPYVLQPGALYHCTGTHRTKVLDYGAEKPRRATCRDLERMVRVSEGLPRVISVSPAVTPADVHDGPVELRELEILFHNTGKHLYNSPASPQEARWTLDLAELMSNDPLSEKPTITIRVNPTTPLVLADEVAQVTIVSARRGAILALGSACAAGTTSPMTLAGTVLMQNVEFLFQLVLAQLARPGAPSDYQVASTIADLRTGMHMYGAVEMTLLTAGLKAMAERYGLPFSANQSADAPLIDAGNGMEKMLHLGYKMAIGLNFLRNAGDLDKASTMSCEQLVIDHEIGLALERFWTGIRVDVDTLAAEVIREVGPGGAFLNHSHTLEHCRTGEHYVPPFLYRAGTGKPSLVDWANERVERMLQSHRFHLEDAKAEKLERYLSEERKEAKVVR